MKKKIVIIALVAVLLIAAAGAGAYMYYRNTHIFVEEAVYEKDAELLDLRGTGISIRHYEQVRSLLPGCEILWDLPFQGGYVPCDTTELTLTELSDEDVALLDHLEDLSYVDATGCTDYDQLRSLIDRRPECRVVYQVSLNGESYSQDVQELSFPDADAQELMRMLGYLPEVKTVTIEMPTMPAADLLALVEAYPDVDFRWNVNVLGEIYPSDTTALDFSRRELGGIEELEAALAYLPALETVELHYCDVDYETLGAYRERQKENYKVIWTVQLSWGIELRTDEKTFMPVMMNDGTGKVWDATLVDLKYCNELICVDVGHMPISHCDWAAYMPELKYLIVADCGLSSIEGVRGLQNLIYLETFTNPLKDYSPLLECPNLKDLNMVNTDGDPAVIAQLTSLERLWWGGSNRCSLTNEGRELVRSSLPDTQCQLNVLDPTTLGWRKGKLYYEMRDVLGMPYFGQ